MPPHIDRHTSIETLAAGGNLYDAMKMLRQSIRTVADNAMRSRLTSELEQNADTYERLLDFFIKGFPDESRKSMRDDIAQKLLEINDSSLRAIQKTDSSDPYFSALRFRTSANLSLRQLTEAFQADISRIRLAEEVGRAPLPLRKAAEKKATDIFNYVWTLHRDREEDYAAIRTMLDDESITFSLKSQLISALMLSSLKFFDPSGLEILIEYASRYGDERLAARAMTATVAVMRRHPDRVRGNRRIRLRIEAWSDDIMVYRRLREVLMNMLRSRDTARIETSLREDIIPGLQKIRPDIMDKMKKAASENDIMSLEENPEWQEMLKSSDLEDKLKELTEIQMDGGDILMGAFSRLKSFPFFNETANWFLPYSITHSALETSADILPALNPLIEANSELCESDRYSMALSLSTMPETQRKMIMSQFEAQFAQLKEALDESRHKSSTPEFDNEAKRFMRDFYRYCRLKAEKDLSGFLTESFDITKIPLLETFTGSDEFITLAAEFYFRRNFYSEAAPLFGMLCERNPTEAGLFEKLGYCHYVDKNIPKAIEAYSKAELFNPDSHWLIRQLAICHKLNGDFEKGALYYRRALADEPENYKVIMNLGHCLLENGEVDEALKQYYHADYMRPELDAPKRALAWGEFIKGNHDKSATQYSKLMKGKPTANDHLNEGHLKFILGDFRGALDDYREYEKMSGNRLDMDSLGSDLDLIIGKGGNKDDLSLLLDMLRKSN